MTQKIKIKIRNPIAAALLVITYISGIVGVSGSLAYGAYLTFKASFVLGMLTLILFMPGFTLVGATKLIVGQNVAEAIVRMFK